MNLIMNRSIYVRLLNLSDGSPFRVPTSDPIMWQIPQGISSVFIEELAMTASRLMMCIYARGGDSSIWDMNVWDWETGTLVRRLPLWTTAFSYTVPGIQPFDCEWNQSDEAGTSGRVPRRISCHNDVL